MSEQAPLRLMGAPGSPYTRKMRAILRYRRIPYELIFQRSAEAKGLPSPKVPLLPTFFLPDESGEIVPVTDSTPLIRRFEKEYDGRSVIPTDPVLAFLNSLLEDYGDEWLTKSMFHFRWAYQADVDKACKILPLWGRINLSDEALAPFSKMIGERQIGRLYVVGSNDTTAPVIEESYRRFLRLLDARLQIHPYLFGDRPASADFALYGQLTQLALFDPTPCAITIEEAPRVIAWTERLEDLSGCAAVEDGWLGRAEAIEGLGDLLAEMGRTYVPVMLANEVAVKAKADQVECRVDGKPWTQRPFPYQAKCLRWLREERSALSGADRADVDAALASSGCEEIFG